MFHKAKPLLSYVPRFTAPRSIQDEDIWEREFWRSNERAARWLRQHPGHPAHVRLPVCSGVGGPLAAVWAAQLQGQNALPQTRGVQERERNGDGSGWHEDCVYQTHHGNMLRGSYFENVTIHINKWFITYNMTIWLLLVIHVNMVLYVFVRQLTWG